MTGLREGALLWTPSEELQRGSNMAAYMRWLANNHGLNFRDYEELWRWSCGELERFWVSIYQYFDVQLHQHFRGVLSSPRMPGARWFDGATLNYAEHAFRHQSDARPALLFKSEVAGMREVSWADLHSRTAHIAAALRRFGLKPGDPPGWPVGSKPGATVVGS
jgi:acetoacetyl-CoA synthetase